MGVRGMQESMGGEGMAERMGRGNNNIDSKEGERRRGEKIQGSDTNAIAVQNIHGDIGRKTKIRGGREEESGWV